MDSFGRLIAMILVIIIVFLFPMQYIAQGHSENLDSILCAHTERFSDTARQQGYIDQMMYEELLHTMDATGEQYDISIEVAHPVSGKEMSSSIGKGNKEGTYVRTAAVRSNNRLHFLSNNQENTIVADKSNRDDIVSFATHTHTPDCYVGHNHDASGCTAGYICCNGVRMVMDVDSFYATTYYNFKCSNCGKTILQAYYHTDTNGDRRYIAFGLRKSIYGNYILTPIARYNINSDGTLSGNIEAMNFFMVVDSGRYWELLEYKNLYRSYPFLIARLPLESSYYYELDPPFMCPYTVIDNNPICNQVVTSITAKTPNQTVTQGDSIDTTAIATYLNGTTGIVNCTSNFNNEQIGNQTVTLTYHGLVGNAKNNSTTSCNLQVTVHSRIKPIGITANLSTAVVNKGSPFPIQSVTVHYNNGTMETVTSGWTISGFQPNLAGTQVVTIGYQGFTTTVTVTVTVKVNLTNISVTPSQLSVERYTNLESNRHAVFLVRAHYEDGTSKEIQDYNILGLDTSKLGSQIITISFTEGGITKTVTVNVQITNMTTTCPTCGAVYELDHEDRDNGCPDCGSEIISIAAIPNYLELSLGDPLLIEVEATYRNGRKAIVTGWTSNYDPYILGTQTVTVMYEGYGTELTVHSKELRKLCPICGEEYELEPDGSDPGCQKCKETVVKIEAYPREVTIEMHTPLPITVTATYLDGHSESITGWSCNFVPDKKGTFDVSIYYQDVSDVIKVVVKDNGLTECPFCGLVYPYRENPRGCPVCSKTIVGMEAYLRNGGTKVAYGSDLNLEIVLIYKDNRRQLTYSGWTVSGYQPYQLGEQTVEVSYESHRTNLTIEVVNTLAKKICPNGHEYYLDEDGTDPGCPYCLADTTLDNAIFYYNTTYTKEIIDTLYAQGRYTLNPGDYITVTVIPKNRSIWSRLQQLFFGTTTIGKRQRFTFGGEVA